jgi:transposase-like protein
MKPQDMPKTLQQAVVYLSDPDRAFQSAVALRWPDGKIACPRCGHDKQSFISTRKLWYCKGCKKQFTVKVGTIFEDSPLGLDKWLIAMWLIVNCKNGISSYELARDLDVQQTTAWFMLQRLRLAMQKPGGGKLSGGVEVDETFIGGKARNMHASKRKVAGVKQGGSGKTIVMGVLQRAGEVRTHVIPDRTTATLHPIAKANVRKGTKVYTDEHLSYFGLEGDFAHRVINHAEAYVDGQIHTNGMENFWSLTKRALGGTYVSVEPIHLFRYLDEQSFRFNNRKDGSRKRTDAERFQIAMGQIGGKRLTYEKLAGKEGSAAAEEAAF